VCKGAHLYNRYLASRDDHDSWGTCTTSAECKTVITAVLTVMSGMDPHMISGNLGRFGLIRLVPLARSILCSGLYQDKIGPRAKKIKTRSPSCGRDQVQIESELS
jgi:hypothetical protein